MNDKDDLIEIVKAERRAEVEHAAIGESSGECEGPMTGPVKGY